MNNSACDIQAKIDGLLTSWAIKYNVSHDYHSKLVEKVRPHLEILFDKVKEGERPPWLIEKNDPFPDSLSYALNYAEAAYMTMVKTQNNVNIMKRGLGL
jgi:hypothetical protein